MRMALSSLHLLIVDSLIIKKNKVKEFVFNAASDTAKQYRYKLTSPSRATDSKLEISIL